MEVHEMKSEPGLYRWKPLGDPEGKLVWVKPRIRISGHPKRVFAYMLGKGGLKEVHPLVGNLTPATHAEEQSFREEIKKGPPSNLRDDILRNIRVSAKSPVPSSSVPPLTSFASA